LTNPDNVFVLDAGVAAKWFLPEDTETLIPEAVRLLTMWDHDQIRFVVPDLFWAELGAVFSKAVRRGWIVAEAGEDALARLRASSLPTVRCRQLITAAYPFSLATGRTVYDSIYVQLAIHLKTSCITADERLVNALGSRFPVRWLGSPFL